MSTAQSYLRRQCTTFVVIVGILAPQGLGAQEYRPFRSLSFVAGPANYDLSGTGWSWSAAARLDLPLSRVVVLEPGFGVFTYDTQFAERTSYLLPEVSLHLQYPGSRVRPYLGVGGGGVFVLQGSGTTEPSVHGAAGVRAAVGSSWGIRAEARLRNITVFDANSSIFEFLGGVSWNF